MSSKKQLDALGDRMKTYERLETDVRFIPNLPIYVRLDGRGFSKFTKKMIRPYDKRLSTLMLATTEYLVKEFGATIGYVQSDEISLVLKHEYEHGAMFEGKVQKLVSTLASSATAFFNTNFAKYFDGLDTTEFCERLPTFDCRIFSVPSWDEATNAILWRYLDAIKNSKQMLAQHYFSHKELQKLNGKQLVDKLKTEKSIIWEDYPEFFRSGVFVKKSNVEVSEGVIRSKIGPHPLITDPFHLYPHDYRVTLIKDTV
jgi:tRNA(His) 5'-end guanylyltransferase